MMKFLSVVVLSTSVLAQTFTDFTPSTTNPLVVEFVGNTTGSQFVSSAQNLPADRVSAAPFVGLTGDVTGNHVLMMVDSDVLINSTTKTTLLHYFQTDLNVTSAQANYTRLTSPTDIPAAYSYLSPSPPAGQIHRYTLLLFAQPANLTKDIVSAAFTMAFAASGKDRVGLDITMFMSMTAIEDPIAATFFEFGEGTLTEVVESNITTGDVVAKHRVS